MKVEHFIFDTSTLISALLFKNSVPYRALRKGLDSGRLYVSDYTEQELIEVISRTKFDKYLSIDVRIDLVTDLLFRMVKIDNINSVRHTCRDPKDVPFLELAVAANANLIISSDSDLLDLDPFEAIRIMKPVDFLELE